jgi:hypothetical protein
MKAQYEELYKTSAYREFSPGEFRVKDFRNLIKTAPDDVIIDFGCGTGRAAKALGAIGLDFVKAVETDIEFHQHDLRKPCPVKGTVGFCTDVMEHIATKDVSRVLRNIMAAVDKCYFQICTVPDVFGEGNLHLTVKPLWWWAKQMPGIIRYARQEPEHVIFVVQRSLTMREIEKRVSLMEPDEILKANILENLKQGYREVQPFEVQDKEITILAGGPSLREFKGCDGPIITVNGAYNWCIQNGYVPSAQIIIDPRKFNERFTQPVTAGCKYLIGSWCHPDIAKSLPKEQVWMWHSGEFVKEVVEQFARDNGDHISYPVFGGSTVMLRGLPLLYMLGFRKFHIWGFDSCIEEGRHHAYSQPENDKDKVMDVLVGGRTFKCQMWMSIQAQEFVDLVKHMMPDDVQMIVEGNGLIAHILKTGAFYGGSSLESLLGS